MECFKFNIEERFQCLSTGQVKYTYRPEYCLPLSIPLEAAINISDINNAEYLYNYLITFIFVNFQKGIILLFIHRIIIVDFLFN